ncbi:MAG: glutathione S-transferase family protein [Pseudolabrys sp.]|nr:glutathione S-transferase family protein [Pseudolabrys sp.]
MITITAFKWVPDFAQGNVRDHRVRWVLNEVGWPYQVRLLDAVDQRSPDYRAQQPFGQVPIMEEDGRATMFETGAIVLDVARRAGKLLPADDAEHSRMLSWYFAALNSIEPYLSNLAEVEYFMKDEEEKAKRRPGVLKMAGKRLKELEQGLGERDWLAGDMFTVADLMISSVLKIAKTRDLLNGFPTLVAHQERCFARPAYKKAIADQCAAFAQHSPKDMKYDAAKQMAAG